MEDKQVTIKIDGALFQDKNESEFLEKCMAIKASGITTAKRARWNNRKTIGIFQRQAVFITEESKTSENDPITYVYTQGIYTCLMLIISDGANSYAAHVDEHTEINWESILNKFERFGTLHKLSAHLIMLDEQKVCAVYQIFQTYLVLTPN